MTTEPQPGTRIQMRCARCHSTNVLRDAWATWNAEHQAWELGPIYDHSACDDCAAEDCIEEIPLTAAPPEWNAETITTPELAPAARRYRGCATMGCTGRGAVFFDRGGVGSWFCGDCYSRLPLDGATSAPDASQGDEARQ